MKKLNIIILSLIGTSLSVQAAKIGGNPQPTVADKIVDPIDKTIANALEVGKSSPEVACASLAQIGGQLSAALLTDANRVNARAMCCATGGYFTTAEAKKNHPKAVASLCEGGKDPFMYFVEAVGMIASDTAEKKKKCSDYTYLESELKKIALPAGPKYIPLTDDMSAEEFKKAREKNNKMAEDAAGSSAQKAYVASAQKLQSDVCTLCSKYWQDNPGNAMDCSQVAAAPAEPSTGTDNPPAYPGDIKLPTGGSGSSSDSGSRPSFPELPNLSDLRAADL